jgi:hypothetical protein
VVDRCSRLAAVAAAAAVAGEHAGPGPRGSSAVPPAGDDVPDEAHDPRYGIHTDEPVRLGLVDLGHTAEDHPDRVAEAHLVQRAQVGVENQDCVHRDVTSLVVIRWDVERTTGIEPATFTLAR